MKRIQNLISPGRAAMITGIISLLATAWLGKAEPALILPAVLIMALLEFLFHFGSRSGLAPYHLLILSPISLLHFSTIGDFQIRLLCFVVLTYTTAMAASPVVRKPPGGLSRSNPLAIWLMAFLIFSLGATALHLKGIHLSGDEPHYLMMAQSIVEDGDFDLTNNLRDRTYTKYLPVEIPLHGKIVRGRALSYHMPGVAFLLVPFYFLYNLVEGVIPAPLFFRLVAGLFSAFFALCLFILLRRQFPERKIFGLWLLFLCLYPLIFHAVHLYPELPAATLMMGAIIFFFGEKRKPWLSGLLLSLVAWFHVKYYPALIALALIMVVAMVKKRQWKSLVSFFWFPAVNLILLVLYTKTLYGSISPADIFPSENYLLAPISLRVKVLLAYFFDQRDGLLFYSPLFFLLFFGFRPRLRNLGIFLWISVPYLLFHAFTTVRGAYSPAGRPLMFISWIFMLLIAGYVLNRPEDQPLPGFRILVGLSVFVLIWLFYHPLFAYQPVFSQTLERPSNWLLFLGSSQVPLWQWFPSFLTQKTGPHPANIIWIGLLVLMIGLYYLKGSLPRLTDNRRRAFLSLLFLVLVLVLCLYPHVHLIQANRHTDGDIALYNNSGNFRYIEELKGFNILAGQTYRIFLEPGSGPRLLRFSFQNTDRIRVKLTNKTRVLFQSGNRPAEQFSIPEKGLKTLKIKRKTVIPLEIKTWTREKQAFLFMRIN